MSAAGLACLIKHLTDADSVAVIARQGLEPEIVPDEALRPLVAFAVDYWHQSGQTKAPSVAAFLAEPIYADALNDAEIDIDEEPDDSIEWALQDLKGTYLIKEADHFNRQFAMSVREATFEERPAVVSEAADQLVTLAMKVTRKDDAVDAREALADRMRSYDARAANRGVIEGMTFGLTPIDAYTNGIKPGELAVLAAGPKVGKAEAVTSLVLTPGGWRQIGSLRPGDAVIGSDGRATAVIAMRRWSDRPLMRVTTDDGGSVVVDVAHDWTVHPHSHGGKVQTVDTETLARKIQTNRRFAYLPMVAPVRYEDLGPLPLHPYLLGLLLGDGSLTVCTPTFCKPEPWLHGEIDRLLPQGDERHWIKERRGLASIVGGRTTAALREMGLMGCRSWEKFIPDRYLRATINERRQLLSGLLDTDGGVDGKGITFCSTSERLALAVRELVLSLGGTARVKCKPEPSHQGGAGRPAWIIRLRLPECPFRLPRKRRDYDERPSLRARRPSRRIVEVTPAGRGDTVCIQVAAADGLYVTEDFLVTHNSFFLDLVALREWERGKCVTLYTLENSVEMTLDRIACLATGVSYRGWQCGTCSDVEVDRVRSWINDLPGAGAPFHVLHPPIEKRRVAALVRDAQVRDTESLLIDQLSHVVHENPKLRYDLQISDSIRTLSDLIGTGRRRIPCLLAHQINREGVKAAFRRGYYEMSDLADSAGVERGADWVFGLYQSMDQRAAIPPQALFHTLAARREDFKHFSMIWEVESAHFIVRGETQLGGS